MSGFAATHVGVLSNKKAIEILARELDSATGVKH